MSDKLNIKPHHWDLVKVNLYTPDGQLGFVTLLELYQAFVNKMQAEGKIK